MKKTIFALLMGLAVFFTGCKNDETPKPDGRLNSLVMSFKHISPRTGEEVTNVFEDYYRSDESVSIDIVSSIKMDKIDIVNGQTKKVLATLEVNGNTANFASEVAALGVPFGQRVPLMFHIYFADAGVDDFDYPSMKSYTFNVIDDIPSIVSFKKADGTVVELKTTDFNIGSFTQDAERGVVASFKPNEYSYIEVENSPLLNFGTNNFSISFWVNSDHDKSDPAMVATMDWGSSNNKGFLIAWLAGRIRVVAGDGEGSKTDFRMGEGETILGTGWRLLTVTFDRAGEAVLYIDGVANCSSAMVPVDVSNGVPVKINQDGTGTYGDKLGASYSDVVFYNYALSASQVEALFNAKK